MKVRLIHYAMENLLDEQITFTEDFNVDVKDFEPVGQGYKLMSDIVIDVNFPHSFPLETTFRKDF